MTLRVERRVLAPGGARLLSVERCRTLADAVARVVILPRDRQLLSVAVVGTKRMQQLARRLRKPHDAAVLAFALDAPLLGEIILCPSEVERTARQWNTTAQRHAGFLFVHGMLHLLGYDHERARDAVRMERLEQKIVDGKSGAQVNQARRATNRP